MLVVKRIALGNLRIVVIVHERARILVELRGLSTILIAVLELRCVPFIRSSFITVSLHAAGITLVIEVRLMIVIVSEIISREIVLILAIEIFIAILVTKLVLTAKLVATIKIAVILLLVSITRSTIWLLSKLGLHLYLLVKLHHLLHLLSIHIITVNNSSRSS